MTGLSLRQAEQSSHRPRPTHCSVSSNAIIPTPTGARPQCVAMQSRRLDGGSWLLVGDSDSAPVCWAADSEQAQSRVAWERCVPRDGCDLDCPVVAWPGVAVMSSLPTRALLPIVLRGRAFRRAPRACEVLDEAEPSVRSWRSRQTTASQQRASGRPAETAIASGRLLACDAGANDDRRACCGLNVCAVAPPDANLPLWTWSGAPLVGETGSGWRRRTLRPTTFTS